jgi:DNA repair exonuclease SbcCD ATPase subunit
MNFHPRLGFQGQENIMTTAIHIEKTENGFAVKFPFELKDSFRELFPSAKWDSYKKVWTVGPRSGKRLETWKAETEQAAESIIAENEAKSELDLTTNEIASLKQKLAELAKSTAEIQALRTQAQEAKALLESMKAEVNQAETLKQNEAQQLEHEKQEALQLISKIIDLSACRNAASTMARNMVPSDRTKKAAFNDAQETVIKAFQQLKEAGLRVEAISFLADANVNRPDRDHPRFVLDKHWYQLTKRENEAEA